MSRPVYLLYVLIDDGQEMLIGVFNNREKLERAMEEPFDEHGLKNEYMVLEATLNEEYRDGYFQQSMLFNKKKR